MRYYRQRGDALELAYNELYAANIAHNEQMLEQMKSLVDAQEAERKGWQAEIRKAKAPGFGFFAGYGATPNDGGEFVVGFGLVWKIW